MQGEIQEEEKGKGETEVGLKLQGDREKDRKRKQGLERAYTVRHRRRESWRKRGKWI